MNNEQCEMNNEQCTMNFARKKERATSNEQHWSGWAGRQSEIQRGTRTRFNVRPNRNNWAVAVECDATCQRKRRIILSMICEKMEAFLCQADECGPITGTMILNWFQAIATRLSDTRKLRIRVGVKEDEDTNDKRAAGIFRCRARSSDDFK